MLLKYQSKNITMAKPVAIIIYRASLFIAHTFQNLDHQPDLNGYVKLVVLIEKSIKCERIKANLAFPRFF
jgi:hypothetical protein